jgi:rhodanese-related sulfurtransferase
MSRRQRSDRAGRTAAGQTPPARKSAPPAKQGQGLAESRGARIGVLVVVLILASVVVIGADVAITAVMGQNNASPAASVPASTASNARPATTWTNVSADQLAEMLGHKDFTLLNVKTPYMGEIDGTDLYIPYDKLQSRASELPANKGAKILVYCRTGTTSAIAAQTLLDLGYTNVWNLTGGMTAWTDSGRSLVQKNR